MESLDTKIQDIDIYVENVGGILSTSLTLDSETVVLSGRNASNRTSFLQSIMAAMGSNRVTLRSGAERGFVELDLNGSTYTRELERQGGHLQTRGEPYLDDPLTADLFAFLLRSNEARQAVTNSSSLKDTIMRPVDTDRLEAEISRLKSERDRLDSEIEHSKQLKKQQAQLTQRRQELSEDLEAKRAQLEQEKKRRAALDQPAERAQGAEEKLEAKTAELNNKQSRLQELDFEIGTEEQRLQSLRDERDELQDELEDAPEAPDERLEELETELTQLRERKQKLNESTSSLQEVIEFNKQMINNSGLAVADDALDPGDSGLIDSIRRQGGVDLLGAFRADYETSGEVTDQLVENEELTCWACGSTARRQQFESILETLETVQDQQFETIRSVEEDIQSAKSEYNHITERQERIAKLRRDQNQIERDIKNSKERLAHLRNERERVQDEFKTLQEEVNELSTDRFTEISELNKQINRLKLEIEDLEDDREQVVSDIAGIEDELQELADIKNERERVSEQITELRTRVKRVQENAVSEFNERIAEVLGVLGYDNIERIWIERVLKNDGHDTKTSFKLHIAREQESGTIKDDTLAHLSESEREVTGIVFALAGYLVHEVYEDVPFMLLDSVEAIDSERIARLVKYLEKYAPYLVVALLPEDAQALSEEYQYIYEI